MCMLVYTIYTVVHIFEDNVTNVEIRREKRNLEQWYGKYSKTIIQGHQRQMNIVTN